MKSVPALCYMKSSMRNIDSQYENSIEEQIFCQFVNFEKKNKCNIQAYGKYTKPWLNGRKNIVYINYTNAENNDTRK